MTAESEIPQRSSSPLKRRASNMEGEEDERTNTGVTTTTTVTTPTVDVDMISTDAVENNTPDEENVSAPTTAATTPAPRAMSVDPPENGKSTAEDNPDHPSVQEQLNIIQSLLKLFAEAPVEEGENAFVVSRIWVDRALATSKDFKFAAAGKKETSEDGEPLGPVDNSDIIEEILQDGQASFVRLKPGTDLKDFELFPEDAWNLIVKWHGQKAGQPPIIRTAVNTADAGEPPNVIYEFHPLVFKIHRLWSTLSPITVDKTPKPPVIMVRSRKSPFQQLLRDIKSQLHIPMERKIRLWSVSPQPPQTSFSGQAGPTPPDSPNPDSSTDSGSPWSDVLIDITLLSGMGDNKTVVGGKDETNNQNYNGKSTLSTYDFMEDMTLVVDEETARDVYVLTHHTRSAATSPRNSATNLTVKNRGTASGRSSPGIQSQGGARGRAHMKRTGRNLGVVGFSNLGNTCYMNSALQCVRSVEELTKYFITGAYKNDINEDNPLGYHGQVAHSYGKMLKEVYEDGKSVVTPKTFKNTVGRCRSTFSGWGQQDSQEFLGFLLDALQEDLNRIKKKPYISKPDSTDEMINDPAAIREMADKVWDITRQRDDSVVADLFTGMYKSTLKCPVCHKVSITFDPFNNLTLPLPVENMCSRVITFYPLNDVPVEIEIELPQHSTLELTRQYVSERTGISMNRLIGAEEFKGKFFKFYNDAGDMSEEINENDRGTIHEVEVEPTNWPPVQMKKPTGRSMLDVETPWKDPRLERMLVPVVHRRLRQGVQSRMSDPATPPHFVVLTPEDAKSEDIIRRKILEKVATFTDWTGFDDDTKNISSPQATTGDTTDVAAQSIDGEDDLVDVTMKDAAEPVKPETSSNKILKQFKTQRPKFIDPQVFLEPQLQNMFTLKYFGDGGYSMTTGWTVNDDIRSYKTLSSRAPAVPEHSSETEESSVQSPGGSTNGASSDGTEDSTDELSRDPPTRMTQESSEEDDNVATVKTIPKRGTNKKIKQRTYGKKGSKKWQKHMQAVKEEQQLRQQQQHKMRQQPPPQQKLNSSQSGNEEPLEDGALIRLGEVIIVEWNEEAWETVFSGKQTFSKTERLKDPTLLQRRRNRENRRTRGITLDECLDEFEKAEVLSEQDMWYCPRCKEHRRASKKFDLWKTPDILICHLKRFSSSGYRRNKLDIQVDFPIEGLDLSRRVINRETGKEEVYDLIAIDDHFGGLGGGHYTAYAKNFVDNTWYSYNDSSASVISDPSNMISSAAYLLFYRRRSTSALGGPRFAEVLEAYDNISGGDDDENNSESGEDQRLVGGSSRLGSSSAGKGVEATRLRAGRGLASGVSGDDDDDDSLVTMDDELPSYENATRGISLLNDDDDEGVAMEDGPTVATRKQQSNMYGNSWNWDSVTAVEGGNNMSAMTDTDNNGQSGPGTGAACAGSADGDYPSDNAEGGWSDNDSDHDDSKMEDMIGGGEISLESFPSYNSGSILSVPVPGDKANADTDDAVTEIHLDSNSGSGK